MPRKNLKEARKYSREYNNRERATKSGRERYNRNMRIWYRKKSRILKGRIVEYFKTHPCVDCGEKDPIVLEFDHVRGKKKFTIGKRLTMVPWKETKKEILKCDVRCANCHRRKTARERWKSYGF